jgi:hypothetical protein
MIKDHFFNYLPLHFATLCKSFTQNFATPYALMNQYIVAYKVFWFFRMWLLDLKPFLNFRVYILSWSIRFYVILSSKLCSRCSLLASLLCDSRWVQDPSYCPWILKCNINFCEDLIKESRLGCHYNNVTRLKFHVVCTCPNMLTVALIKYKLGTEVLSSVFINSIIICESSVVV